MVIDFDGLTILISVIIFVVASIMIKVITKKTYIYFIFLSVMFLYLICVVRLTVFPLYINCNFEPNLYQSINWIPFKHFVLRDAVMNFVMAIPFGFGLPFVVVRKYNLKIAGIIGIAFGTVIESLQYIGALISDNFTVRYIDVNDVIFNCLGVIFGYFILRIFAIFYIKVDKSKMACFWKYVYNVCSKNSRSGG